MEFVKLSELDAQRAFGYAFEQIKACDLDRLKREKLLLAKDVRHLFQSILDGQSEYDLTGLSHVSIGMFGVNIGYWPYIEYEDAPIAEVNGGLVFYATARHSHGILSDESYVYILWPLMSQKMYIVPCEMLWVASYRKMWGTLYSNFLNSQEDYIEANGHPFSASILLTRTYRISQKGLIRKKVTSVEAVKDVVNYIGDYEDAIGQSGILCKKIEYPPFWLEDHQEEIPLLKDLEIPEYGGLYIS